MSTESYTRPKPQVSSDTAEQLALYLCLGVVPQGYLAAVLHNDLAETMRVGTASELRGLLALLGWLSRYMPPASWGSVRRITAWVRRRHEVSSLSTSRIRDADNVKRVVQVIASEPGDILRTLRAIDRIAPD